MKKRVALMMDVMEVETGDQRVVTIDLRELRRIVKRIKDNGFRTLAHKVTVKEEEEKCKQLMQACRGMLEEIELLERQLVEQRFVHEKRVKELKDKLEKLDQDMQKKQTDAESWSNNYAMLKDFYEDRMENEAKNIKQCGDSCRDTANNYSQLKSMYFEMKLAIENKDKEIEKLKSQPPFNAYNNFAGNEKRRKEPTEVRCDNHDKLAMMYKDLQLECKKKDRIIEDCTKKIHNDPNNNVEVTAVRNVKPGTGVGGLECGKLRTVAQKSGYFELCLNSREQSYVLSFGHSKRCGGVRVRVYHRNHTATININQHHCQAFVRRVSLEQLEKLFKDPSAASPKDDSPCPDLSTPLCWHRTASPLMDDFLDNVSLDNVKSISLGHATLIVTYNNGDTVFGANLPQNLYNSLNGSDRGVDIVCLGPSDNSYFVQFSDGYRLWDGLPADLHKILTTTTATVVVLSYGSFHYYVRLSDDIEHWFLPVNLSNVLNERRETSSLAMVHHITVSGLGLDWAVQLTDNTWLWDSQNFDLKMKNIIRTWQNVRYIAFGNNGDFVCLYE